MGVCLCTFVWAYIWTTSSGPGHQRHKPIFDSSFYWKLGYNTSL